MTTPSTASPPQNVLRQKEFYAQFISLHTVQHNQSIIFLTISIKFLLQSEICKRIISFKILIEVGLNIWIIHCNSVCDIKKWAPLPCKPCEYIWVFVVLGGDKSWVLVDMAKQVGRVGFWLDQSGCESKTGRFKLVKNKFEPIGLQQVWSD